MPDCRFFVPDDNIVAAENMVTTCIAPRCTRPLHIRGLCIVCYQSARSLIAAGRATWADLESLGLSAPAKHGGGTVTNPLKLAFADAKAKRAAVAAIAASATRNRINGHDQLILLDN
jgi:hypothetical protein